jgi:hypothetical protein
MRSLKEEEIEIKNFEKVDIKKNDVIILYKTEISKDKSLKLAFFEIKNKLLSELSKLKLYRTTRIKMSIKIEIGG